MTDMNITTALLPGTTQAQQTVSSVKAAQTDQAAATASSTALPTDTVDISPEALAAAYDQAYLQLNMGELYTGDTLAGAAFNFTRQVARDGNGITASYAGVGFGDTSAVRGLEQLIWKGRPMIIDFQDVKSRQQEAESNPDEFSAKLMKLLSESFQGGSSSADAVNTLKTEYGINLKPSAQEQAIEGIYTTKDSHQGLQKAIDYALQQRGIDKASVAGIDVENALYNGTVKVTFTDGKSPLELDEDYVTNFATRVLREEYQPQWDNSSAAFKSRYVEVLDSLGLDPLAPAAWSVKADGTFHIFVGNESGDGYDDHVIGDPELVSAALAYSRDHADEHRLSLSANTASVAWFERRA